MLAQKWSPPSDSGPEGFQEKQSTSSYRPSFIRHVPALVEDEFEDPVFCQRVAGLERMLRVKARMRTLLALNILPLVLEIEIWLRIPRCLLSLTILSSRWPLICSVTCRWTTCLILCSRAVLVTSSSTSATLEDGIVAVRASTAGDRNHSGLLEVIESVFPRLVTLRVSSLCFAAASAFLSDPYSALHSLPALTDAHADDSLMHVGLNSSRLDTVNLLNVSGLAAARLGIPCSLVVPPGRHQLAPKSLGWARVCGTEHSGVWVLKGDARTYNLLET